jgi:hypothetical protein
MDARRSPGRALMRLHQVAARARRTLVQLHQPLVRAAALPSLIAVGLVLAGCPAPPGHFVAAGSVPVVTGDTWGAWRTLSAEQQVAIDATRKDGSVDHRTVRGVVAVERPGSFRLRAVGPADITVFDSLDVDGNVQVLHAIAGADQQVIARLAASVAGDLAAAYALRPAPAGRILRVDGAAILVEEPERAVRLYDFVYPAGHPDAVMPRQIDVDNQAHSYKVHVAATSFSVDQALDPALFKP